MPAKIRLARHGKKKAPYYHIVVADGRAPRDGKYIERIGTYNPITNPAVIDIDFDKALGWLNNGAVPTDTCRAILSYTGVYMKKHLLEGVKKGAFDEATANTRFEEWKLQKLSKIQDKKNRLSKDKATQLKERNEEEAKVKETRAQAIAKKLADAAAKQRAATEEATAEAAATETAPAEATATEAPKATDTDTNQPEA